MKYSNFKYSECNGILYTAVSQPLADLLWFMMALGCQQGINSLTCFQEKIALGQIRNYKQL